MIVILFCSVRTDLMDEGANSTLSVARLNKSDSGNYTCSIGPTQFFTTSVHVLNGKQEVSFLCPRVEKKWVGNDFYWIYFSLLMLQLPTFSTTLYLYIRVTFKRKITSLNMANIIVMQRNKHQKYFCELLEFRNVGSPAKTNAATQQNIANSWQS